MERSQPIAALLDTLERHFDDAQVWRLLEGIWQHERWFDAPRQKRALETAADAMRAAGVADATVEAMPADGRTRFQDWIAPLAWDCEDARLSLADTGEVLGDRQQTPCTAVLFSAPLEPTTAAVVDGDALSSFNSDAVDGKWILTSRPPVEMKRKLLGRRPAGVISDYLARGTGFSDTDVKWHNDWGDGREGWYVHAIDQHMTGFSLSPAKGKVLRARMAGGPTQLTGFCNSRLYEGAFHTLTATIPGHDTEQEVWILAHSAEQGAHDNCSGQAVITAAMIQLRSLIDQGVLQKPARTIRLVMVPECIGITAFVTAHEEMRRKAVMAFYIDGVGDRRGGDRRLNLHLGPASNPSFGWALAGLLTESLGQKHKAFGVDPVWHVNSADDMIADPLCGIPTQWLGASGASSIGYHSSADTPAICTPESLRSSSLVTAAWAYLAATLDDASVTAMLPDAMGWIAHHLLTGTGDTLLLRKWSAGEMFRSLRRMNISADVIEPAAARFCPPNQPPLPELPSSGPCYQRNVWGTVTMESLPSERRHWSRWSASAVAALYWTDGQRPLDEIDRLVKAETGAGAPPKAYFDALVEAGIATETQAAATPVPSKFEETL
jgi:hypothetical protein